MFYRSDSAFSTIVKITERTAVLFSIRSEVVLLLDRNSKVGVSTVVEVSSALSGVKVGCEVKNYLAVLSVFKAFGALGTIPSGAIRDWDFLTETARGEIGSRWTALLSDTSRYLKDVEACAAVFGSICVGGVVLSTIKSSFHV